MLLIIIGCSKNSDDTVESQNSAQISNINPLKVKIGDTITINGSNLEKLSYLSFRHHSLDYFEYDVKIQSYQFLSRTNEKITVKVPDLVNENISIFIPADKFYELDLVGIIPIINNFEHVAQIQVINETTVFLTDNTKIYKSTDGFYNWDVVYEAPNGQIISTFYFLNENQCWIGLQGNTTATEGVSIHYSENGGIDFNLKFQVNNLSYGNKINRIKFTSLTKGFFVDNNQKMYVSDNSTFENIFDYYPNLSSLPLGEIWDFTAINDDLIFLAPNGIPNLIKIDNQNITHSEFDLWPLAPLFFNNIGYVQTNSDIHKTTDLGNSWVKIKTFENYYPQIEFLNSQEGFAFVNYSPAEMHITTDGGTTWKKYFTFPRFHEGNHKGFTEINGLIGSANGRLWKYRKE